MMLSIEVLLMIFVLVLFLLLAMAGFVYEYYNWNNGIQQSSQQQPPRSISRVEVETDSLFPHLQPIAPVLPIFAPVDDSPEQVQRLMDDTLSGTNPTMAGITAILQRFVAAFHSANRRLSAEGADAMTIIQTYFRLTDEYLKPFDEAYRNQPIFPIRDDGSIFLSLAAFREHLLAASMRNAFDHAKYPDKLFVGAVVQNCFGRVLEDGVTIDTTGLPCKTGAQVVGKNAQGQDQTKVSDAPPDPNGIEEFCSDPQYRKYCDKGQVRVLYVHETESVGPAVARYYASKLWGGETYFMQCDSHLLFAQDWDAKYIAEVQATRNYPHSVLSSYPPGFQDVNGGAVRETPGSRLCRCETILRDPNPIVRMQTGKGYDGHEPRPTQIPFIAAGFFFAHAEFLVDVPFDPYMPWLFMGEEVALSMRAWTHGWDIYAPRKNLIAHQYRPGRMGLPKFWGSVNRLYKGGVGNNQLQHPCIKRIKHMVGYPDSTIEKIKDEGIEIVLTDIDYYGIGSARSWDDYMEHACMHIDEEHDAIDCCPSNDWCAKGLKD